MSIKVASLVFNPMVNDSRVIKIAESLSSLKYDVEVIAHGKKDLKKKEFYKNFAIIRFFNLDRQVASSSKKFIIYLKFISKSIFYCKKFDVLHCNDLNTLPIAFILKKIKSSIKVVYDAHEYETEVHNIKGIKKYLIKKLEKFLIKYADDVICVSESIAVAYKKLYNIEPSIILNTPALESIAKHDIFRNELKIDKNQKIFLYQGSLSPGRGIEKLIKVFKEIEKEYVLIFMGYGVLEEYILKEIKQNTHENIFLYPAVSPETLLKYTASADYGISLIEDICLSYRYCLPNKMFEYIMSNLPVLVSDLPEMKKIVLGNNIGKVVNMNSIESIKNGILEISKENLSQFSVNLQSVQQQYNWDNEEKKLLNMYKKLVNP